MYIHTYITDSWSPRVLRGSLGLSQPASQPPSQPANRMTGLFYPCSAPLGLSGLLWASLSLSVALRASLGLSGPLGLLYKRQDNASTHTMTDSWGASFPQDSKLPEEKTRQYLTAGAPVFFEALRAPVPKPASPPASQPTAQHACFIHAMPLWASLGLSVRLHMCLSEALWASLGFSGALAARYHGIFPRYVT